MTRRKRNRKVEIGPNYDGEDIYFSPHDLSRFELAQARVTMLEQEVKLEQAGMHRAEQAHAHAMQAAKNRVVSIVTERNKRAQELIALRGELEKLYGLDLSKCAYDDTTGRIRILPE